MFKKLILRTEASLCNGVLSRSIRYSKDNCEKNRISLFFRNFLKENTLEPDKFLFQPDISRFIGGVSGRTGTTWLKRLINHQSKETHQVIGEQGLFVLSGFRKAPYEYYQVGASNKARREYLKYFKDFILTEGFGRYKIYGGKPGFGLFDLLPKRGIKLAFNLLKKELESASTFEEIQAKFGNFYLSLFNHYSAISSNGSPWISKEPSYGRHANELFNLIPNAKLVIMVRDGRDTALSMYEKGWQPTVKKSIDRWRTFANMTLKALEDSPEDQYLLVNYSDLIYNFSELLYSIFDFLDLPDPNIEEIMATSKKLKLKPDSGSVSAWKTKMDPSDIKYFEETGLKIQEQLKQLSCKSKL
jgi:hypothetical protein